MKTKNQYNRLLFIFIPTVMIFLTVFVWGLGLFTDIEEEPYVSGETDRIVVGVSQLGSESGWRTANTESVQSVFTNENGYFLLFSNARQKQENQIKAIRSFISQRVDYIVFAPVVENGWRTVLQEAKEAGIPVIMMDRKVEAADQELCVSWVGTDSRQEGVKAGRWLEGHLRDKGVTGEETVNIVVLTGTEGASSAIGRSEGFREVARDHANWKILEEKCADFTSAKGKEVMEGFLRKEQIVDAIPLGVRLGIAPAIGMMLMNIGIGSNAGVYSDKGGPFYVMRDFFGSLTAGLAKDTMGSGYAQMVLSVVTMFVGLFVIVILAQKGIKAAVILGMLVASVIYWIGQFLFLHTNPFASLTTASFLPPVKDMANTTLFKFNFSGFAQIGGFTIVTLIVTFCIIDMFDTIGTLVGTASRAGMLDKNGKMPQMKEALLADAVGTVVGSATGTSTVTTFVESASGVEAGGRTGLTALTTGIVFLACMFIAPIAAIIPAAATSSALIYVGVLMLTGLKNVHFDDMSETVPVALMLISMPVSGSIGHAIGIGLIAYTIIKVFTGKAKDVSVLTYVLSLIFLLKFFLVA